MTGYFTAAGYGEAEYEDKHSRFIGHVSPVSGETEVSVNGLRFSKIQAYLFCVQLAPLV